MRDELCMARKRMLAGRRQGNARRVEAYEGSDGRRRGPARTEPDAMRNIFGRNGGQEGVSGTLAGLEAGSVQAPRSYPGAGRPLEVACRPFLGLGLRLGTNCEPAL